MNDNFDSICHKTVRQNCADPCKFACDSYREDRTYKKLQENRSQHLKIKIMLFNFVAKWFCCRRAGRFNVWRQFSKAGIWFSEKLMAKTLTWYYTNIWRNKTIFSIYWSETCTHLQQLKTSRFLSQILFYFVCIYYRGFCSAISSSNVHVNNLCKKIAAGIGVIKRSRAFVPFDTLQYMYSSLVQPHFDYCSEIWVAATKHYLLNFRNSKIARHAFY